MGSLFDAEAGRDRADDLVEIYRCLMNDAILFASDPNATARLRAEILDAVALADPIDNRGTLKTLLTDEWLPEARHNPYCTPATHALLRSIFSEWFLAQSPDLKPLIQKSTLLLEKYEGKEPPAETSLLETVKAFQSDQAIALACLALIPAGEPKRQALEARWQKVEDRLLSAVSPEMSAKCSELTHCVERANSRRSRYLNQSSCATRMPTGLSDATARVSHGQSKRG